MSAPSSSAPPVPPGTFQTPNGTNSASPKDLRDFLRALRDKELHDDNPSISVQDRQPWLQLIAGLLEQVFGCFPYFKPSIQGTTNERIGLTDVSLEVLSSIGRRVDSLCVDEERLAKQVFVRLLGLCTSTETWLEVTDDGGSGGLPPNTLYSKACDTLVAFLQILSIPAGQGMDPDTVQRGVLHEILQEAMDVCTGESNALFSTQLLIICSNDLCSIWIVSSRCALVLYPAAFQYHV
jgi:hypothetical protein